MCKTTAVKRASIKSKQRTHKTKTTILNNKGKAEMAIKATAKNLAHNSLRQASSIAL